MPPDAPQIISFLHDCLGEDRSSSGVPSVFASKIRARRFLTGTDDALAESTGIVDLPPSQATQLVRDAALYRRERELLHGSLFIAGLHEGRPLAAPLLLHPIEPDSISGASFQLDPSRWRINSALFQCFDLSPDWENQARLPFDNAFPGLGGMLALIRTLSEALPDLDTRPVDLYPQLSGPGELQQSSRQTGLRLHPAAALFLAERGRNVRGVLDETRRLASLATTRLGTPLQILLGEQPAERSYKRPRSRPAAIPAVLSDTQERLLESAATRPLTLCHGPPGTGKTFTLSAAAIDHATRGEPVLIVCRSSQAADVVEQSIDKLAGFKELTLRSDSRKGLRKLRDHIDLLLSGAITSNAPGHQASGRLDRALRLTSAELSRRSDSLEKRLTAALDRGRWFNPRGEPGWWTRFQRWRITRGLEGRPLMMEAASRLSALHQERIDEARRYLETRHHYRLARLLDDAAVTKTLRSYRTALRRRASQAQDAALSTTDPRHLLDVFPIWIVTSDDVHRLLPLQPDLFPLVILDEASQCDIASALPALHRGRRALISGDPRQLRHVSFLAGSRLARLAARHDLDDAGLEVFHYRNRSLIDLVADRAPNAHFLAEHFRSRPELIRFSNRQFYGGHLRLMREAGWRNDKDSAATIITTRGTRNTRGVNVDELDATAGFLADWLEQQDSLRQRPSIGFLSPFRNQVDALLEALEKHLDHSQISRLFRVHNFTASTAHGFQGDERDVMIISLALTPDCPAASRRFLERPDVFNVSITRARNHVVAIRSLTSADLPRDSLLRDWFLDLEAPPPAPQTVIPDKFMSDFAKALAPHGYHCETGHSVAGIALDLVVFPPHGQPVAIDLIGQPGIAGAHATLRSQLLLRRAALPLLPLSISEWRSDPDRCIESLFQMNPPPLP